MKKRLKFGTAFLSLLIAASLLTACGKADTASEQNHTSDYTQGSDSSDVSEVSSDGGQAVVNGTPVNKPESEAAPPSHKHKYSALKTPATCKERGYTTYTCTCGASYVGDYVNGSHEYVNNKCKYCGKVNTDGIYTDLKNWVLKNGTVNGDYISYSRSSDNYGGYSFENFSLTYWNDTEKLEFCLHSPLDETYSHNFFIYIPKAYTGNYDYISSYYYRSNGVSKYESKGFIEAAVFTKNYPLKSTSYSGAADRQNSFLEESRVGICDALSCLSQFLKKEGIGYTLKELGFTNF